jgi:hypothetical protein
MLIRSEMGEDYASSAAMTMDEESKQNNPLQRAA